MFHGLTFYLFQNMYSPFGGQNQLNIHHIITKQTQLIVLYIFHQYNDIIVDFLLIFSAIVLAGHLALVAPRRVAGLRTFLSIHLKRLKSLPMEVQEKNYWNLWSNYPGAMHQSSKRWSSIIQCSMLIHERRRYLRRSAGFVIQKLKLNSMTFHGKCVYFD